MSGLFMLPKGDPADVIGGRTIGGGGFPVLPASLAIWLRIFCTFSGGRSGEQMPCFFNLCTLKKYLLQNSLQQISQKASALMTPICRSFSGVKGPLGIVPGGPPPKEIPDDGELTLGILGMLGIIGGRLPEAALAAASAIAASRSSFRRWSKEGRPPNINGLKFKWGGRPGNMEAIDVGTDIGGRSTRSEAEDGVLL